MGGSIIRRFEGLMFPQEISDFLKSKEKFGVRCWIIDRPVRVAVAASILYYSYPKLKENWASYIEFCDQRAQGFASPGIVYEARLNNGKTIIVDDKLKGYQWLKENTPADSRVMSWWDYGYQITGIGNRTSLADGNTWNHEHIATIGRILSSHETKAWRAMRHLADYALVHVG